MFVSLAWYAFMFPGLNPTIIIIVCLTFYVFPLVALWKVCLARVCLQSVAQDAENMKQILDQIRALHPDLTIRTSTQPPSEPSRQLTPLKVLTEQLKRRTGAARPGPPASLSPELADKADLVLKELQSLKRKIDSNLQLLKPFVTFLRTAQQVRVSSGVLLDRKLKMCDRAHRCSSFLCYTLKITESKLTIYQLSNFLYIVESFLYNLWLLYTN